MMKLTRFGLTATALFALASPGHAAFLDFETAGQYSNNFRFLEDEGALRRDAQSDNGAANDYLRVTGATGASRVVTVYDTTPVDGLVRDTFGSGLTVEFDARIPVANQSVGIFLIDAASANESSAYLALFNVDASGVNDRIRFSPNGSPSGGQAGTLTPNFDGDSGYAASTTEWVHVKLVYTINELNQPVLDFTVGNLTQSMTFATTAFPEVEVALRISPSTVGVTNFLDIDNFSVVPEPASLALATVGLVLCTRRSRR